jgi:hypothetical protein
MVLKKVLRSLPIRFDPKISAIEERVDLGTLSMDELHGIFTTYEMRIEQAKPVTRKNFSRHPRRQIIRTSKIQNQVAVVVMIQTKMKRWLIL